nr:MAG TPA: hypothetical protein [Caudoviricetes sp.]
MRSSPSTSLHHISLISHSIFSIIIFSIIFRRFRFIWSLFFSTIRI